MRGQRQSRSVDAEIAALAERQHGVAARAQLIGLGLSSSAIDRRVSRGALHLLHRGVYAVGHRALTREGRWMAAVLAGGDGAALSHRAAGALWGVMGWEGVIEVTTPRQRRSRDGVRFVNARLPSDETTVHDGIPITTPPRTLLDLAAVLPRRRLERAVNQAEVLRLTDRLSLPDLLGRYPTRRGAAALRALAPDAAITRSELERTFLSFVEQFDLPRPQTNTSVHGHETDCTWPRRKLIVELDGHTTHSTRQAFERDRERDRVLTTQGWRVVPITWRQLRDDARAIAADLRRLLVA